MAVGTKATLLCAAAAGAMMPGAAFGQTSAPPAAAPQSATSQSAPVQGPVTSSSPSTSPSDAAVPPSATPAVQDQGDSGAGVDVVVTGFRASLDQAINLKRDAITFRDSIVAEDIGRFPEANIAESLQRIPGVELERDGNSNEGSTIRLRGLPSTFTVTTFNGSPVFTTSGGGVGNASRTFNYDVFPSELFGRADVYKSPLAELSEGGIAGVVDLRTARPFDGKGGRQIRYAISGNYNSTSGDYNPRGNFLISQTSGNFGALISVAAARTTNGRAGFSSTGNYSSATVPSVDVGRGMPRTILPGSLIGNTFNYNFTAPGINLNGFSEQEIRDAILPRFFIIGAGANERERLGASASFQYKDASWDISLDGLYSVVADDNQSSDIRFPIRDSVNALALIPRNVRIDKNNNLQGTLGNAQFFYASFFDQSETRYKYLALNTAYRVTPKLRVSAQLAISDSRAFRNNITLSGDARQSRNDFTFDTTNPVFPTISTSLDLLDRANYITNGIVNAAGVVTSGGPSNGGGYREEDDRLKSGRLVVDWDYQLLGIIGALKAGITYNQNTKTLETRATNNLYNDLTIPGVGRYGAPTTTLAQRNTFITSFLTSFNTRDFVPGAPDTLPQSFLAFDRDFAYNVLDAVNVNRAAQFNFGATYEAVETIKAAFIQSDFTFDLFGRRLRANVGGRLVETTTDVNNFIVVGGTFFPNEQQGNYRKFLPSATFAYDITDRLIARGAFGRTFTRAAIQDIAASISLPPGGAGNLFLNLGNPELQPEFATSLDGALEWYFAKGGVLSVAAYKKTITGRALRQSTFAPFNTLGIPSSIFTGNIQRDLAEDPTLPVELRRPINLERYSLSGLEIAYQQQFNFLPAPFDGFGALASFTRVNTQGLVREYITPAFPAVAPVGGSPGAPAVPAVNLGSIELNEVPETTYQLAGYYEKGPLAFRVTYNWKDEVANIGQTSTNVLGFQRYANPRGYLDANASYRFTKWLELRVDVINITETETFDFFRDVQGRFGDENSRVEGATQNGRTITVGIRGQF